MPEKAMCILYIASKHNNKKNLSKQFGINEAIMDSFASTVQSNQAQFMPNHVSFYIITTNKCQLDHVSHYLQQNDAKLVEGILEKKPTTKCYAYAISHHHSLHKPKPVPFKQLRWMRELKLSESQWLIKTRKRNFELKSLKIQDLEKIDDLYKKCMKDYYIQTKL